jgi:hypothetical protein
MVWSFVELARGDLTRAFANFDMSVDVLAGLQEANLWQYHWHFANNLIHFGWIARGHEVAEAALRLTTAAGVDARIRERFVEFLNHLRATYPELTK